MIKSPASAGSLGEKLSKLIITELKALGLFSIVCVRCRRKSEDHGAEA